MDDMSLAMGAALLLVGFALGRLTASRKGSTTVYVPRAGEGRGAAGDVEVEALLRGGQKIEAIRRYREMHGVGLKEAKDAVDAIQERLAR